jgi:hypothetical protein
VAERGPVTQARSDLNERLEQTRKRPLALRSA